MCHASAGRGLMIPDICRCGCPCLATLTIEDEIEMLESHKNALQDRIEFLNRKISVLKTVK